mgnify:CR=1 FL=1
METVIEFRASSYDDEGHFIGEVVHKFSTEDYLPDVLYHFKSFLQGAGYNYVDNVYVIKSDGVEVGEE